MWWHRAGLSRDVGATPSAVTCRADGGVVGLEASADPLGPGGRPLGSRNRHPATSHDVGKTVKRDRTVTERRQHTG